MLDRSTEELPFGWVAGDDEFGRCAEFRAHLHLRRWRYVLDVPCNTSLRGLSEAPPTSRRRPPWRRADSSETISTKAKADSRIRTGSSFPPFVSAC